ncbi:hypothetical protein SAMN03097699_0494 [Flavobacteriaceae bacterium MAR_2010_188]|nr:hypothetical protein SAMN03097699_0494 [Flavobacteriaceae bacterium MAR_2010_188]
MLEILNTFSSFSVDDIDKAKNFYKSLGLRVEDDPMGIIEIYIGNLRILVYPKPNHQPATFTVLNFMVADIEKAVSVLKNKDIIPLQYPDLKTDKNGISRNDGPLIAWFKDPAGNILSVIESKKN